ncbi:hypothetical protein Esti_001066 [Eimeria stiedai]
MRLQQQSAKHKSKQEIAALMEYPLLGFSMPSTLNPVEYLSKLTRGAAATPTQSNAFRVAANPRTVGTPASRSRPQAASRRYLQDKVEMLGDDALLDEVVKKKRKPTPKQRAANHNKKKKPSKKETEAEDDIDDDDDDEATGAAKVVQKLQDTVEAPFQDPVFTKSGKHSDQRRRTPIRPMGGPCEDAETDDAFAAETTADDEDDENVEEKEKAGVSSDHTATAGSDGTGPAEPITEGDSKVKRAKCKKHENGKSRYYLFDDRGKADAFLENSLDDDDEEELSQDESQAHRSRGFSAASQQGAHETAALARAKTEAEAETSAAEKKARDAEASLEEENKLIAAENEANQAKNGLKTCAGGSFLNCQQESKGARPQPSAGARVVR